MRLRKVKVTTSLSLRGEMTFPLRRGGTLPLGKILTVEKPLNRFAKLRSPTTMITTTVRGDGVKKKTFMHCTLSLCRLEGKGLISGSDIVKIPL